MSLPDFTIFSGNFKNPQQVIDTFLNIPIQKFENEYCVDLCKYLNNIYVNVKCMEIKHKILEKMLALLNANDIKYNLIDTLCERSSISSDISMYVNVQKYSSSSDLIQVIHVIMDIFYTYSKMAKINQAIKIFDIIYENQNILTNVRFVKFNEMVKIKLLEMSQEPYSQLQDVCNKYLKLIFNVDDATATATTTATTTTTTDAPHFIQHDNVILYRGNNIQECSKVIKTRAGRESKKPVKLVF